MKPKIVLICGRENLSADANFLINFTAFLEEKGFQVIHESEFIESDGQSQFVTKLKQSEIFVHGIVYVKRLLLARFERWITPISIYLRAKRILKRLNKLNLENHELYIVGRSAGAIVATYVAQEIPVKVVFAIGYPFIHPIYGKQRFRFMHLIHFQTPMYIFQGISDEYGSCPQIMQIPMSEKIHVDYFETNHDFRLSASDWLVFTSRIEKYAV